MKLKSKSKRLLSILLALCMLLTLAPLPELAADAETAIMSPVNFAVLNAAIKGDADSKNSVQAYASSPSALIFSDLAAAAQGTSDSAMDLYDLAAQVQAGVAEDHWDGTWIKNDGGIDYFGYGWDDTVKQWGVEAWNESNVRHIRLNADVVSSDTTTILVGSKDETKTVILDLNGHIISGAGTYVLGVNVGSTVTVKDNSGNGIITGGVGTTTVINDYGTFHLESGTVYAKVQKGISVASNGTATISAGAVVKTDDKTTNGRAVNVSSAGFLTTSGKILSACIGIYTKGTVTVTGGTVDAVSYGVYALGDVEIKGGAIKSSGYGIYAQGSDVTVGGGTIDASAGKYGVYTYNKANLSMSGGTIMGGEQAGVCIYWGGTHTIKGGEIHSDSYGISIWGYQELDAQGNVIEPYGKTTLTVNGGKINGRYCGITGNGKTNGYSRGGTVINIQEGADIHGDDLGIYHPQLGELNIDGGTITGGLTGIEMRSGYLNMSGGTVAGSLDKPLGGAPNGSGSTVEGVGIAVSQHTTKQEIKINISGGTIQGHTSFYEGHFQDNTDDDLDKVSLAISGGQFVSKGASVISEDGKTAFITGGSYSCGVDADYLGTLPWNVVEDFSSFEKKPDHFTGQVSCIKGKVASNNLPYHVGYLTGESTEEITMKAGTTYDSFVPDYKISGTEITAVKGSAVVHVLAHVLARENPSNKSIWVTYQKNGEVVDTYAKGEQLEPVIEHWKSKDTHIATVGEKDGVVTAVKADPNAVVSIIATLFNQETVPFQVKVVAPPCTVTFDLNYEDAPEPPAPQTVEYGGTATKPEPIPQRADFVFDGWYRGTTDGTGKVTLDDAAYDFATPVTTDLTLYAKWKQLKYTMHYGDGRAFDGKWGYNYAEGQNGWYVPHSPEPLPSEVRYFSPSDVHDPHYPGVNTAGWYFLCWMRYEGNDHIAEGQTPDADCGDIDYFAQWILIQIDVQVDIKVDVSISGIGEKHALVVIDESQKDELAQNINLDTDVRDGNTEIKITAFVHNASSDLELRTLTDHLDGTYAYGSNRLDYDVSVEKEIKSGGTTETTRLETLAVPIEISFAVPDQWQSGGTVSMFRAHTEDDQSVVVEKISDKAHTDAATYTVKSDRFSTYTMIYVPTAGGNSGSGSGGNGGGGGGDDDDYILHYESNGGTVYPDERYARNAVVTLDKVPVRVGYQFTGWYADKELTKRISSIKMTSDKTVYAGWRATDVPELLNGDDHFAYIVGYADGTVQPLNNITRAEVATIFFRLLQPQVRDGSLTGVSTFADVQEGMWFNTPVATMAKLGILKGRTVETFVPNAPITRAEFAAICARFDTSATAGVSTLTDISGHWAEGDIRKAAALGWIMGYPDGAFRPDNYITRAEAMTMINRVLRRIPERESDLLPAMKVWPDNQPGTWYYLAVQEATNSHSFRYKNGIYERWTALTADPDWLR